MKVASLGANCLPSDGAIDRTVDPPTGLPSSSVHVNAAPPHSWTSIPRCRLYQACSAGASLALKKMPPIPVTRFMEPPRSNIVRRSVSFCRFKNEMRVRPYPARLPRLNLISRWPYIPSTRRQSSCCTTTLLRRQPLHPDPARRRFPQMHRMSRSPQGHRLVILPLQHFHLRRRTQLQSFQKL